jgi:hypothetical protein
MRKHIYIFSCILIFVSTVNAQTTGNPQRTYRVIRDNPGNVNLINIGFDPLDCTVDQYYGDHYGILRYGINSSILILKNLNFEVAMVGDYKSPEPDKQSHSKNSPDYGYGINGVRPYSKLSVCGTYYYTSIEKEEMFDLFLAYGKTNHNQVEIHTKLPSKEVTKKGIRYGWTNSQYYIKPDGMFEFNGYLIDDPNKMPVKLGGNDYGTSNSLIQYNIGFSKLSIQDFIIDVEGFGKNKYQTNTELYFDYLFSTNHTIDNIYVPNYENSHVPKTVVLKENTSFLNWGFRFGFKQYENQGFGVKWNIEIGIQPGIRNGDNSILWNFFLVGRCGISLSQRLSK